MEKLNEKLNERVINYFKMMIDDFSGGNDSEYKAGRRVSFKYEDIEKNDLDNYDEEDVENFRYVREFIKNAGGEVKYIGMFNGEELEYTFKVVNRKKDIKCSWIEPKW
jgi:hypothetical protein